MAKYYHATKRDIPIGGCLATPTGRSEMNVLTGGVVYLCDSIKACERYGTVYEIACEQAVSYKAQLKKQGRTKKARYTRGVFVSLPENTKILRMVKS